MRNLWFGILATAGFFFGCGDEDDGDSDPRPFNRVDADGLASEPYSDVSGDGLRDLMNDIDDFYATHPDDGNDNDGDGDDGLIPKDGECPGVSEPRMVASGDRITMEFAFDAADCGPSSMEGDDRLFLGMYVELHCPGVDFSPYNGITMSDSEDMIPDDICDSSDRMGMIANFRLHMKSSSDGSMFEIDARAAESNGDEPCYQYRNGDSYNVGECLIVDYSKSYWGDTQYYNNPYKEDENGWGTAEDSGPQVVVSQLRPQGLVYQQGDKFYRAGSFDFVVNGWSGQMSYSDASTNPTYQANKAGEGVEDSFSPYESSNLGAKSVLRGWSDRALQQKEMMRLFF